MTESEAAKILSKISSENNENFEAIQTAIRALKRENKYRRERKRFKKKYLLLNNAVKNLLVQIRQCKRNLVSENNDYLTGYQCALSVVEGMIAEFYSTPPKTDSDLEISKAVYYEDPLTNLD